MEEWSRAISLTNPRRQPPSWGYLDQVYLRQRVNLQDGMPHREATR